MARHRTIHARDLADEALARCSDRAWRLYESMKRLADCQGNVAAGAWWLRGQCFAARPEVSELEVAEALAELGRAGLLKLYEVKGQPFAHLERWGDQKIDRPSRPIYPGPELADGRAPAAPRPAEEDELLDERAEVEQLEREINEGAAHLASRDERPPGRPAWRAPPAEPSRPSGPSDYIPPAPETCGPDCDGYYHKPGFDPVTNRNGTGPSTPCPRRGSS